MTEEKQGGTTPDPEAIAPETNQAPEPTVAAVAVADDPATDPTAEVVDAESTTASDDTPETTADAVAPEAVVAEPPTSEAPAAGEAASESDAPSADDAVPAEAPAAEAPVPTGAADAGEAASDAPADTVDAGEAADAAAASATEAPADAGQAVDVMAEPPADTAAVAEDSGQGEAAAAVDETAAEAEAPAPEPPPKRDLGPEPTTMEELLAEQDSEIKSFKHGDVVEGNVVRIDKDEILVDIGAKSEGVVSNRELYGRHAESQPQLNIGDTVLVYVLQPESQEGHAVLSLRRAGLERKWRSMQEQFEAGVIIEAPVIDHNKGGLIVDCGIRGFVPISQIVDFPRRPQNDQPRDAAQEIAEKLQPFVGRKLRLKILEVNRKANRLILSEKVALYEERREKRDELFSSLQVGQKVSGTVRSIAPFGVFIDLGGIDGLVHKSELSWNKVNNPEAGYKVGDEVEAEVIDINHERGRISLSIRRLQPDPWHSTVAAFKVGDVIDGTVTKLVNFGAFVRVRDGLEGLIHISELSHQRVAHPGDVVHEGQTLKLKIISLDSERHRLGLSLKQAEEPPARPAPEPGQPSAPRGERRPRPERGYSMSDAVQEPEGGIDNTLASAFAQVRQQLAEAEGVDETPAAEAMPETTEDATASEAVAAETEAAPEPVEAVAEPAAETEAPVDETTPEAAPEPVEAVEEPVTAAESTEAAEPVAEAETAEAATAEPEAEPTDAVAEPATTAAEPVAEAETPVAEAPVAEADAEPEAPAAEPAADEVADKA
ncbi:MAG TPA: 30S ribosomal protein S1 [Candidatus Limnocylindrales bacterium]|nr:30S ribosomal protein S1 [Candidatus Limnocylindrales bacterium]